MSNEVPSFVDQPLSPDELLNRHLFRDRFDYELKYDSRLPVHRETYGLTKFFIQNVKSPWQSPVRAGAV